MLEGFRSAARKHGCDLDISVERKFEHFRLAGDSVAVRCLERAMGKCGIEPHHASSGGGSDANIFNRSGLQMAVMHIGLVDAHTPDEYISKEDLLSIARVVTELARLSPDECEESVV